ncbi:outer membrane beta-barrel family protein [Aquimarina agarivorans]|uniref:outer membrane beta-barrel family protein n=1 Tax=Aquimarina agarivorans TaxID=980584 RepID=UPI00058E9893|nr:outer membrane beta-barrel family protein [Aquimarina agarivorans]
MNFNLGEIILTEDISSLKEIVIQGRKKLIEKKVDRLIFNVGESTAASGGTAIDALKAAPRLRVQNEEIKIVAKGRTRVMINDRMINLEGSELTNYLKNIQSSAIKSIEVITNPPPKYDAEGNSGIINIKLKHNNDDHINTSVRSTYKQATYPTGVIGGAVNYKKTTTSLFSDINYTKGSILNDLNYLIDDPNQLWRENIQQRKFTKSLAYKVEIDQKINDKITIGALYSGNISEPDKKDDDVIRLIDASTNNINSLIKTNAITEAQRIYNTVNAHAVYDFHKEDKKLTLDLDYFNFNNTNKRSFSTTNFDNQNAPIPNSLFSANNEGKQNIDNYSINIDMEHPLEKISLNYGGKLSFSQTENDVLFLNTTSGMPVFDATQSNEFDYNENTQALYFSATGKFSEKLTWKAGLRAENTDTKGNSVTLNQITEQSYFELFPTAYLSYQLTDNDILDINYGRRIDRPTFSFLNPFRWFLSNVSFFEGNPLLRPAFSHNIELSYSNSKNLIASLWYSKLNDGFEYIAIVDQVENTQQFIASNYYNSADIGLYTSLDLKINNWFDVSLNTNIYHTEAESTSPLLNPTLSGFSFEGGASTNFVLVKNRKLLFNMTYMYISDGISSLEKNEAYSQFDTAIRWQLFNKSLQISLVGNDLFKGNRSLITQQAIGFTTSYNHYRDDRSVRLSLVYNFGKKLELPERNSKNSEEKNRIN